MREYTSTARMDIPAAATITDVVFRRAKAEPDAVMLRKRIGLGSWQEVTARQFHAEVVALAKGLVAAGIEPGGRAGLAVDEANKAVSRAKSIRRFRILSSDFTEVSGQLTPSLKVRREVVAKVFAVEIEALYRPSDALRAGT